MPDRFLKLILANTVPAGLEAMPTLTIEAIGSAVITYVLGIEQITISLVVVQGLALISSALTRGFRSEPVRADSKQIIHVWIALAAIEAIVKAKVLPVDPYPYMAGSFIAFKALVILKNTSDSGVKTGALDRIFDMLKARPDQPPPQQ